MEHIQLKLDLLKEIRSLIDAGLMYKEAVERMNADYIDIFNSILDDLDIKGTIKNNHKEDENNE